MPTQSEHAAARSFLWRWLAAAFTFPEDETWQWLHASETLDTLVRAAKATGLKDAPTLYAPDAPRDAYLAVFGHTVRGDCPPHEIEYGELKADALFQPHRLADIAAFYNAFGLELAEDANDRVDHIAMECEFYSVLCAKEAQAEIEGATEHLALCHSAQKQFLREHLARWTPAFSRRLERIAADVFFQSLAKFLREAVAVECARFGLQPGNEDLQLRPAEEMADPCGACGLANVSFPGVTVHQP